LNDDKLKTLDLCLIKKSKGVSKLVNVIKFGNKVTIQCEENYSGECELITFKVSVASLIHKIISKITKIPEAKTII